MGEGGGRGRERENTGISTFQIVGKILSLIASMCWYEIIENCSYLADPLKQMYMEKATYPFLIVDEDLTRKD